jgi:hypothetical protein
MQCTFAGLVLVQCTTLDFLKSARVMIYMYLSHTLSFESVIMPTFLMISRHSPENCPMNNEKMKKLTLELPGKLGGLEKKHGIKRVGAWTVIPEHLLVWVYEAPSSESLREFSMEPEMVKWMAWNTSEIKLAMSLEESMKLLK